MLVLLSCTPGASPNQPAPGATPRAGGTLLVAIAQYISPLDMIRTTANQTTVASVIYESLYERQADGRTLPGLAEKTEVAPNALTWTITLRSGVKYHDGTDFDAASVKWNLDTRKTHPTFTLKSQMAPIQEVKAVDSKTVQLVLRVPTPALQVILSSQLFGMISPTAYTKFATADEYARNAAGTGPFKLQGVPTEAETKFVRNDAYWGKKPYLDGVTFRLVPNATSRLAALEAGDVHVADSLNDSEYERLRGEGKVSLGVTALPDAQIVMWFNFANALTADKRVRQAIAQALDRVSYKQIFRSLGDEPPNSLVPVQFRGSAPSSTQYPFNLTKAKQLLADAGIQPGTPLQLITQNTQPAYLSLAQLLKQDLDRLGFVTSIRLADTTGWLADMVLPAAASSAKWQISVAQQNASYLDAEAILFRFFPSAADAPKGSNWQHYTNPQVDALLEQQAKTVDVVERDRLLAQIQQILFDDLAGYPLLVSRPFFAYAKAVRDIDVIRLTPPELRYGRTWIAN
jgi:peptide/nickel transport system substrate-binding protein